MAKIIAGIGSSHVPAIGAALDNGKTEEPYWKRVFSGFEKSKEWMAKTKPDVAIVVYNDPPRQQALPSQRLCFLLIQTV